MFGQNDLLLLVTTRALIEMETKSLVIEKTQNTKPKFIEVEVVV